MAAPSVKSGVVIRQMIAISSGHVLLPSGNLPLMPGQYIHRACVHLMAVQYLQENMTGAVPILFQQSRCFIDTQRHV